MKASSCLFLVACSVSLQTAPLRGIGLLLRLIDCFLISAVEHARSQSLFVLFVSFRISFHRRVEWNALSRKCLTKEEKAAGHHREETPTTTRETLRTEECINLLSPRLVPYTHRQQVDGVGEDRTSEEEESCWGVRVTSPLLLLLLVALNL